MMCIQSWAAMAMEAGHLGGHQTPPYPSYGKKYLESQNQYHLQKLNLLLSIIEEIIPLLMIHSHHRASALILPLLRALRAMKQLSSCPRSSAIPPPPILTLIITDHAVKPPPSLAADPITEGICTLLPPAINLSEQTALHVLLLLLLLLLLLP